MSNHDIVEATANELVPVATALPLSPDQARQAMRTYQEISTALIDPAADIQVIQTKKGPREFPKRSAFQKLANAYRVSTQIMLRELTHNADGRLERCDAIVRATHPDGRYSEGDGACSASEDRFGRGADKIDHDLPATAVTRATNRAISNLVAFGAVSAEEADATTPADAPTATSLPAWAQGVDDVAATAQVLVDLLTIAGVPDPAERTQTMGQAFFDTYDNTIPRCVHAALEYLLTVIQTSVPPPTRQPDPDTPDVPVETPTDGVQATEDPTP